MPVSRRKFLQTSGLLTAAGLLGANKLFAANGNLKNYSLQFSI